jgi:RhtB (resistance to homoserine/threonine) family protein
MDYLGALAVLAGMHTLAVVSPGPNVLFVSGTAMHRSRRAGLAAGLGVAAGSITWSVLTISGLGVVMAHLPWLYDGLRLAGAAYLVWLGARMAWKAGSPMRAAMGADGNPWANARKAWLVNMTNPKSLAYYVSVFAVLLPPHAPAWVYGAAIAMTSLISCTWYCALAWLLSGEAASRSFLKARPAMERIIGLLLVGLGVRMLAG